MSDENLPPHSDEAEVDSSFEENDHPVAAQDGPEIQEARFSPLGDSASSGPAANIELLLDVTVTIAAEMGTTALPLERVLELKPGSVVELDRPADEPIDLLINGKRIARGEVVVIDDHFGVRITEILTGERAKAAATAIH